MYVCMCVECAQLMIIHFTLIRQHPPLHYKSTVWHFRNKSVSEITGRDVTIAFQATLIFHQTDVDVVRDKKLASQTHPQAAFIFFFLSFAITDTRFLMGSKMFTCYLTSNYCCCITEHAGVVYTHLHGDTHLYF